MIHARNMDSYDKNRTITYRILTATGFIASVAALLIARLLINFDLFYQINRSKSDGYLDAAYIGGDGRIYACAYSFKDAYLSLISAVFKVFGNNDIFVIYIHVAIELIAMILIFIAINRFFGGFAAFIAALILALYPVGLVYFIPVIILWREAILIYLSIAFGLFLLSFIKVAVVKSRQKKMQSRLKQAKEAKEASANDEGTVEDPDISGLKIISDDNSEDHDKNAINEINDNSDKPEQKQEETVELLINPLPLPKKREHRELDYDHEVADEYMKYDIEVTEENMHFDIDDAV